MNNIIMGLLYIEEQAGQNEAAAEEEKENLPRRIEEARQKLTEHANSETGERVAAFQNATQKEAGKQIEEINRRTQRQIKNIEKQFSEKNKQWENEIYDLVLGER